MSTDTPGQDRTDDTCDLYAMFQAATRWLERHADNLNTLNVFPVPDGDTGTNMTLTMRAAMEQAAAVAGQVPGVVAQAVAHGALMGARGNSGVILSQILRGLAKGLTDKQDLTAADWAEALYEASASAYRAVTRPVEGTILTVIREAADAARDHAAEPLPVALAATVDAARIAVEKTPTMLPVLREAGVVDAGGMGLFVLFEGALRYLQGEADALEREEIAPVAPPDLTLSVFHDSTRFGYCTEFMIHGEALPADAVRERMLQLGDSVLVVGDEESVRVHVHVHDPGVAISYGAGMGTLRQVKVQSMDEQHSEFAAGIQGRQATPPSAAVIAVASGAGLMEIFRSLGVSAVVAGGQTSNPSTADILAAIGSVAAERVIVLPNNPNIVLAAQQAATLSSKQVAVLPARSVPQGISAMVAFQSTASWDENLEAMSAAIGAVRSGEITRAVRDVTIRGRRVLEGQFIGVTESEIRVAGDGLEQTVLGLLDSLGAASSELITLYAGEPVSAESAQAVQANVRGAFPGQEIELIAGGQPHYHFLVSVE